MQILEKTRGYGTDTDCLFMDLHSAYSLLTEWNYTCYAGIEYPSFTYICIPVYK
jgi:hypothetical protein